MPRNKPELIEPTDWNSEPIEPAYDAIGELARLTNLPAESVALLAAWLSRALPHHAILCLVGRHAPELATRLAELLDTEPRLLPEALTEVPNDATVYISYSPVSLPDREWNNLAHAARKGVPILLGCVNPLTSPLLFGEVLSLFLNAKPAPAGEWAVEPLRSALARLEPAVWQLALRNHQLGEAHALAQTEPLLERIPRIPKLFSDGAWEGTPRSLVLATSPTTPMTMPSDTEILQRLVRVAPALELLHNIETVIELTPAGVQVRLAKCDAVHKPEEVDPFLESLRRELHAPNDRERLALCVRVWELASQLGFPSLAYGHARQIGKGRFAYEAALRAGSTENLTALLLGLQELARPEAEAGEPVAPEPVMV